MWDEVEAMLLEPRMGLMSGDKEAVNGLLEDAMASPGKDDLVRASQALERVYRTLLARLSPEVRDSVMGRGDPRFREAYLLGQVDTMQSLTAYAARVRPDDDFRASLGHGPQGEVARALLDGEADPAAVAGATGLPAAAVDAALRGMIQAGSVDFRHAGGKAVYFLTPPASAVLEAERRRPSPR